MDDNFSSTALTIYLFNLIGSAAITFPAITFTIFFPGSGVDLNFISDHENAVETNSKLSDKGIVFFSIFLECLKKFL